MTDTTSPATTGATDEQIEAAIAALADDAFGGNRAIARIYVDKVAPQLIPAGYRIIPDAVLAAGRGVTREKQRVYAVNAVFSRHVSHDYEPWGIFSTEAHAAAYKAKCERDQVEQLRQHDESGSQSTRFEYEFDIDEWIVDELADLSALAAGEPGE